MVLTDEEIIKDKGLRIAYGEHNFWFWFQFHFGFKSKKFHKDWMQSLQSDKNTFIEAFRASRKTTIVRGFVVWCICYKKHPSIIWQSFENSLSGDSVREIAKMLFTPSIINDYGKLFPIDSKKEDLAKSSLTNFESTNGVRVAAKSLGQTIRGSNTFDLESGISARPTLLVLDDIDVIASVSNVEIINQNERKILGETIAALDPLNRKIIFLGNTINEDGIVPRFRNRYSNSTGWDVFHQPLFNEQGINQRPEVFTNDVVQILKDDGKTSFNQNYLLVPSTSGSGIFSRQYFDYFLLSHFENLETGLLKSDMKCAIIIDPAFSTDKNSDDAAIVGLGEHIISKRYYILDGYSDTSAPSKTIAAVIVMYNNMVANGFKPEFISVESVAINKRQTQFIDDLRAELLRFQIPIPVYLYIPKQRKEDRIKLNLESVMSLKGLKTNRNMDTSFISKMESQFLEFPYGDHDDIIDVLSQGVEVFRKGYEAPKPQQYKKPIAIDPNLSNIRPNKTSSGASFNNYSRHDASSRV